MTFLVLSANYLIHILCVTCFLLYFQGSIKIKVEVWDSDDNGDDHVDFLHSMFRAVPYYNASSAHAISYTLSARTTYESPIFFFTNIFFSTIDILLLTFLKSHLHKCLFKLIQVHGF